MKKVNIRQGEQRRKNLLRRIAIISIAGLILQMSMVSLFVSSFISSISKVSIASEALGTCNWGEWQFRDGSNYWQNMTDTGVTKTWCDSKSIEFHAAAFTPDPTPTPTSVPQDSGALGTCNWGEWQFREGSNYWQPRTDSGVIKTWCDSKSIEFHAAVFIPDPTPTPTPVLTPTPTPDVSPTPTLSAEPTPIPSVEPTPSSSPDLTPTPEISPEPTVSPTPTPSVDPNLIPVPAISPEPSIDPIPTVTPVPTTIPTPAPVITSGGGGSSVVFSELSITNESMTMSREGSVTISWLTSHFSTSRVIYDTISGRFDNNSASVSYGYANYKEGDDSGLEKVTFHSVTLTGLIPGTTYYYRTVSVGSLVISEEHSFSIPEIISYPVITPIPIPVVAAVSSNSESFLISSLQNASAVYLPSISPNVELSIVDYLNSIGQSGDFDYRSTLALQNGISDYTGTAEQNVYLLGLIKNTAAKNISSESAAGDQAQEIIENTNPAEADTAGGVVEEEVNSNPADIENNDNKLQAGLATVTEDNSILEEIIKRSVLGNIIISLFLTAVIILIGNELWVRVLRNEKN